jgi:hypothetical protein
VFDPAVTNICFSADGERAYVTAAGTGRLYLIEWPRPGRPTRSTPTATHWNQEQP